MSPPLFSPGRQGAVIPAGPCALLAPSVSAADSLALLESHRSHFTRSAGSARGERCSPREPPSRTRFRALRHSSASCREPPSRPAAPLPRTAGRSPSVNRRAAPVAIPSIRGSTSHSSVLRRLTQLAADFASLAAEATVRCAFGLVRQGMRRMSLTSPATSPQRFRTAFRQSVPTPRQPAPSRPPSLRCFERRRLYDTGRVLRRPAR